MTDNHFPKVDYSLCQNPQKRLIGGVCIYQGLFGAHGKCSLDFKSICKPIQKYLTERRHHERNL